MRRLNSTDDRGATALIMALVVSSLLMSLGYLVITVGGWYVARTMDQNAADSAAEAVAEWCGTQLSAGQLCSQDQAQTVAAHYADGSSNGGLAQWAQTVCGTLPGLTACSMTFLNSSTGCPATGPSTGYVDVLVTPRTDGNPTMKNLLASGTQRVSACAQAGLITAGSCVTCVGITISLCEWNLDTANGTSFAASTVPTYLDTITARRSNPAYGLSLLNLYVLDGIYDPRNPANKYNLSPPAPSNASIAGSETVLYIHGGSTNNCPGASTPAGGFGWTAPSSGTTCSTAIVNSTYAGAPGNAANDCYSVFDASRTNGTPIYIPVYDSYTGGGSGTVYHLAGLAAFVVTGWDVGTGGSTWGTGPSSRKAASSIALADSGLKASDTQYCGKTYTGSPSNSCVYGYFTHVLVPAGVFGPGPGGNLGLESVALTG
ncbi:hypothetical protein Back2_14980 [Nocardioides baekrokdamisoli]|uniref:Uncharacterized protein n=1 Tax=Nocardioides baekrokdamisoli TaxID=1804624 RepID=A0A3G9IU96_9ACTN|nr:pilus assembly protein TadG-related protein [Nocardioides baekrokdamisoli]BBH17211.1 hypothetical protein Back2_14980 [Nocardioides baekrokdamisoli]